ncbi:hypothetical protein JCM5350_001460 [Sporobolomyces pararoseus]
MAATAKGKGKATETIYLDDSDEDEQMLNSDLQLALEQSIAHSRPPMKSEPSASTSTSSSKKHSRTATSDSSESDLEILPLSSTTSSRSKPSRPPTSTPSLSQSSRHKDKKPRILPSDNSSPKPSTSTSASSPSSLKKLHSSIDRLLESYASKRITRPQFVSQKIEFRDQAKSLGIDFESNFGDKFERVENGMTGALNASTSSLKKKGKGKDVKGKGKAKMYDNDADNEEEEGEDGDGDQDKENDHVVDRRLTSAQVRAQQGGGKGGYRKGPLPNAEILRIKQREWEKAKIVPLTFGQPLGGQKGPVFNKDAMEKAKRRALDREAKRRREARKKGGVDGWMAQALAGASSKTANEGAGIMPGGFGGGTPVPDKGSDSDSSFNDSSDEEGPAAPQDPMFNLAGLVDMIRGSGRKRGATATPAMTAASQELAAARRRIQNANMRSTQAVDDAVAALGMKSQEDIIPGMRTELLSFQWIGLAFMVKRETDSKVSGGVLADEMGLGKTVQTIALMLARRSHDPEIKTNLVVVPLSLLSQWEDEIEKFAIGQAVHIYHGSNKNKAKSKEELEKFDVVITTHSTLALEWPKSKKKKKKKDGEEAEEEEPEQVKDPGLLFQIVFYRAIIDEAHVARNPRSRISKAIAKLDAVFRWALTGTPMINTLQDYYPLHRFLRNRPWKEYSYYRKAITALEKKDPVEAGRLADSAIGPFILRRRKTDQLGGKTLVTLPPKTEMQITLKFDPIEREIYDQIEAGYQAEVNKYFRKGTLLKNFHFILVLILRLKQLCVHPHLMVDKLGEYDRVAELEKAKEILGEAVVKRILRDRLNVAVERAMVEDLEEAGGDSGCCPICGDPIIAAVGEGSVTPCGHVCCSSCLNEILQQPDEDILGEKKCKKGEAPCPLCRAPFSAKTLFDLECFEPDLDEVEAAVEAKEAQEDKKADPKAKFDIKPKVKGENMKGKGSSPPARIVEISDDDEDLPDPSTLFDLKPRIKPEQGDDVKPRLSSASRVKKEEKDVKPRFSSPSIRDAKPRVGTPSTQDRKPTPSSSSKLKSEVKGEESEEGKLEMSPLVPSTKMMYILKKLRQYEAEDAQNLKELEKRKNEPKTEEEKEKEQIKPDTRTIILSQFVAALDLLDRYLTEHGIMSVRFQGSTSADERRAAIKLLAAPEGGVKVMLLSTKAGGVGLNLTSACRVLSLDLAWSKAVEAQAFDRTYRLGQRRAVEIERIIVEDTIEERILNLQARKTLLSDMSLAEGQGDPDYIGQISVPDILSLFRLDKNGNRENPGGPGGGGRGGGGGGGGGRGRGRGGFGSP